MSAIEDELGSVRFRVVGRVQGVGFRHFTAQTAFRLGVTGWCRNTADGAVEGEANGMTSALTAFLALLESGPPAARVDQLVAVDADTSAFEGFEVRR